MGENVTCALDVVEHYHTHALIISVHTEMASVTKRDALATNTRGEDIDHPPKRAPR